MGVVDHTAESGLRAQLLNLSQSASNLGLWPIHITPGNPSGQGGRPASLATQALDLQDGANIRNIRDLGGRVSHTEDT